MGRVAEHRIFCTASNAECFTCAKCHCGLDKRIPEDFQVISNSHRRIVQCGKCLLAV